MSSRFWQNRLSGIWVKWGQCCPRVTASPCLPNGPITQLSPYLTQNPGTFAHCHSSALSMTNEKSDLNHFDEYKNSFSVYLSLYINVAFDVCLASGVWWKVMSEFSLQGGGGLAASSASSLPPKIHWIFFTKPHLPQMPHCCALYRDQLKSVIKVAWMLQASWGRIDIQQL